MSGAGRARRPQAMSADATRTPVPALPVSPESQTVGRVTVDDPLIQARDVNVFYGEKRAIKDVNIDIARNQVLAMIGPSGCGKSTFLRCLNRMNDTIEGARVTGHIRSEEHTSELQSRENLVCRLL